VQAGCESWCNGHTDPWNVKCAWSSQACSGCTACQACSTVDCAWTSDWNCPNQAAGRLGAAGDDGSQGYECCCNQGFWQQAHSDYTIRVKSKPQLCLNAQSGNLKEGDAIQLHTCSAAPNEQFEVLSSDNTIRVKSKPQMCLNANSGNLKQGDAIQLYTCSAAPNEQFEHTEDPTKPSTHAVSCQSWCEPSSRPWATKCEFNACLACASCADHPGQLKPGGQFCESWCKHSTQPWTTKCSFEQACADCIGC
jgi:hypothetical protein